MRQGKDKSETRQQESAGHLLPAQLVKAGNAAVLQMCQNLDANQSVVQMVRKRVMGNAVKVEEKDVFYDREDGRYYNKMTEGGEVTKALKAGEAETYRAMADKDRSPQTILAVQAEDGSFIREPKQVEQTTDFKGNEILARNAEFVDDPVTVRLYAEGNFDHASVLAEQMKEEKDFEKLLDLDGGERPKTSQKPVMIKGTEFDTREGVRDRYDQPRGQWSNRRTYNKGLYRDDPAYKKGYDIGWNAGRNGWDYQDYGPPRNGYERAYDQGYYIGYGDGSDRITIHNHDEIDGKLRTAESKPGLEHSFSGRTGDLTRRRIPKQRPVRQYNLIQATFFWLPGSASTVIRDQLIAFLENQYDKVKTDGYIRITLANRNNADKKGNDENQYRRTADEIMAEMDKKPWNEMYECKLIELKENTRHIPYSKALAQKGLNPGEEFKHTMTDRSGTVGTAGGDVIIQARKLTEEETAVMELMNISLDPDS